MGIRSKNGVPAKSLAAASLVSIVVTSGCAVKKATDDSLIIRPFGRAGSAQLELAPRAAGSTGKDGSGNDARFQPNFKGLVGASIGYSGLSLGYAVPLVVQDDQSGERGKTKGSDLQLHAYWRHFGLDLVSQRFEGFYREYAHEANPSELAYTKHADMTVARRQANLIVVSDPESVDLAASFNHGGFSDESGFTFLAMASADQSSLAKVPSVFELDGVELSAVDAIEMESVGLLGGVGLRGYLDGVPVLSGIYGCIAVAAGPALYKTSIEYADGETEAVQQNGFKTDARFALGIDKGTWFAGSSYWGSRTEFQTETYDGALSSSSIESFFGLRL